MTGPTRSDAEGFLSGARRALGRWSRQLRAFRPAPSRLSIDIGSRQIKVIESEVRSGRLEIKKAICFDTPAASVVNYAVRDAEAIGALLRENLLAARIRATSATTCVPGAAAVLKRFKLPLSEAERLSRTVRAEVESLPLFGSDSLCIDYQVCEAADEESLDVLVAAARSETVQGYVDALAAAGVPPDAVDIDSLALANMIDTNHGVDPSRTIAFVHVGAELCALGIQSHASWVFTGNVGVGADSDGPMSVQDGRCPQAPTPLQPRLVDVAREVDRALRFYWPESAGDRVDEILLSGGGAQIPELSELLSNRAGCVVRPARPFLHASVAADTREQLLPRAAVFSVAAGLAVRTLEWP